MKFRVCTYNIHKGFSPFNLKPILVSLKQFLISTNSSIVCLQEVIGSNQKFLDKHGTAFIEKQFEFLSDSVWPEHAYGQNAVYPHGNHGNAILSEFEIIKHVNSAISVGGREQRGILHSLIQFPDGKRINLFNTHLNLRRQDRKKQLKMIISLIENEVASGEAIILAGDFNDWKNELSRPLEGELGLLDTREKFKGRKFYTFPSSYPILALDRIYYKNLKLDNCEVIRPASRFLGSDHLPLVADFISSSEDPSS